MSGSFPVVLLTGSPFERGRQHGTRFRNDIAAALAALPQEHSAAAYAAAHLHVANSAPSRV
jgi:hypothetical protein